MLRILMSLSLSSNSCVFPAAQSNGHSYVFPVFCNPLFYTCIPIKILCFSCSYIFSFLRFKGDLSLYLSSNSCVFPAAQSNSHSYVFPVFCNPLFYTYIPIKILRFSYSYVFSILRFKGALRLLG